MRAAIRSLACGPGVDPIFDPAGGCTLELPLDEGITETPTWLLEFTFCCPVLAFLGQMMTLRIFSPSQWMFLL